MDVNRESKYVKRVPSQKGVKSCQNVKRVSRVVKRV